MKLLIIFALLLSSSLFATEKEFKEKDISDLCQAVKDNNIGNISTVMWRFHPNPFPTLIENYDEIKCTGNDGMEKELLIYAIDEGSLEVLNHLGELIMKVPIENSIKIVNRAFDYLNKKTKSFTKMYQIFSNLGTKEDDKE